MICGVLAASFGERIGNSSWYLSWSKGKTTRDSVVPNGGLFILLGRAKLSKIMRSFIALNNRAMKNIGC